MSDAPLATSVPAMPIAVPMSAALSAGASLTPSPVMATTPPCRCSDRTMAILSSGWARENTFTLEVISSSAPSSTCSPVSLSLSSSHMMAPSVPCSCFKMPISRAMAEAVIFWSPVIMMTRTPAPLHSSMASRTPVRGGSTDPKRPMRARGWLGWGDCLDEGRGVPRPRMASSRTSAVSRVERSETSSVLRGRTAKASTRRAFLAMSLLTRSMSVRCWSLRVC
mmetsp:Transcript_51144/g.128402  ORF Transcript_51144/g.128402 Transcript_51144/m.128402 type:complete len:223 (-) Transcript_51144:2247-2915(-)